MRGEGAGGEDVLGLGGGWEERMAALEGDKRREMEEESKCDGVERGALRKEKTVIKFCERRQKL